MQNRNALDSVEQRGHPIRRMLPVRRAAMPHSDDGDLKLFALSFTAFFVCFYTFLI